MNWNIWSSVYYKSHFKSSLLNFSQFSWYGKERRSDSIIQNQISYCPDVMHIQIVQNCKWAYITITLTLVLNAAMFYCKSIYFSHSPLLFQYYGFSPLKYPMYYRKEGKIHLNSQAGHNPFQIQSNQCECGVVLH